MNYLNKLERKFGKYAIPNLTLWIVLAYATGYVIMYMAPGLMQYLTLEQIKKQCNIDAAFEDDDNFLEMLGDAAEDMTAQLLDCDLTEIYAENGEMPATIMHAMRILVDYFYSVNRGSSSESIDIPNAVYTMLKLYRSFR